MALVINLFAGPGAGKSTTAAGLFYEMKSRALKVELVVEYAKELHYDGHLPNANQLLISTEQYRRQKRLVGHVDYIITDCPLIMGQAYTNNPDVSSYISMLWGEFVNYNVFVNRVKPFETYGRRHDFEQSKQLDSAIRNLQVDWNIEVNGDREAPEQILVDLLSKR